MNGNEVVAFREEVLEQAERYEHEGADPEAILAGLDQAKARLQELGWGDDN